MNSLGYHKETLVKRVREQRALLQLCRYTHGGAINRMAGLLVTEWRDCSRSDL